MVVKEWIKKGKFVSIPTPYDKIFALACAYAIFIAGWCC